MMLNKIANLFGVSTEAICDGEPVTTRYTCVRETCTTTNYTRYRQYVGTESGIVCYSEVIGCC
jgi:hypothetical protein